MGIKVSKKKGGTTLRKGENQPPVPPPPPPLNPPLDRSPWIGPQQVVRQATGHTVGIQKDPEKSIVFVHVDDLKLCPGPQDISWIPGVPTDKSLCASTCLSDRALV